MTEAERKGLLDKAQAEGRTLTVAEEKRFLDLVKMDALQRELNDETWNPFHVRSDDK